MHYRGALARQLLARAGGPRRMMASSAGPLYLGFDCSTQGLKVTAVDQDLTLFAAFAINYQKEFGAAYGLSNGVKVSSGDVVTQPTLMFINALEIVLQKMSATSFPFERVAAISGSGQQHGSAYFRRGARDMLRSLKPGTSLLKQLEGAFRVSESPIWMDSSTTAECAELEAATGGPANVAHITGSRAYERFTGNQISKIAKHDPHAYAETERIALISSMMCSILLGDYAPIDHSDGSGMNLLDIRSKAWSEPLLALSPAAGLRDKLGEPAPSHSVVGRIHPYYTSTYGIPADCRLVAWSGDNPCSVAGLGLQSAGDVAVSLGTSDTMFGITGDPTPGVEGHIFVNPVDPHSYMGMLCYKNGSLTRERIRDAVAGASWETFAALVQSTPVGNSGHIGFYFDHPEITPIVSKAGIHRYTVGGATGALPTRVASFEAGVEARAVLEGQFLSMRLHGECVGISAPKRLIVTGGASRNLTIVRVLADVFGAPVFAASQTDSASLGAAYRAAHGLANEFVGFSDVIRGGGGCVRPQVRSKGDGGPIALTLVAEPDAAAHDVYTAMLPAYRVCEASVLKQ